MSKNLRYLRLTSKKLLLIKIAKVTNVPMPPDGGLSAVVVTLQSYYGLAVFRFFFFAKLVIASTGKDISRADIGLHA